MANEQRIKLWVEALRSGQFQQCKEKLSDGNSYCCLGVACEVAIANGLNLTKSGAELMAGGPTIKYGVDEETGELPQDVAKWLDLCVETDEGYLMWITDPAIGDKSLIELNDSGVPFAEIADRIEAKYLTNSKQGVSG